MTMQITDFDPIYSNFRSAINHRQMDRAWRVAMALPNPDENRAAMRELLRQVCKDEGVDHRQVEFTLEDEDSKPNGKRWNHGGYEEMVELMSTNYNEYSWRFRLTVNRKPYVGMLASDWINSDSYGGIITYVSKNGKTVKFMRETEYEAHLAAGTTWEGEGVTYTRRERRKSGKRGWARKGTGIDAIRYSGLSFGRAVTKQDPHF